MGQILMQFYKLTYPSRFHKPDKSGHLTLTFDVELNFDPESYKWRQHAVHAQSRTQFNYYYYYLFIYLFLFLVPPGSKDPGVKN